MKPVKQSPAPLLNSKPSRLKPPLRFPAVLAVALAAVLALAAAACSSGGDPNIISDTLPTTQPLSSPQTVTQPPSTDAAGSVTTKGGIIPEVVVPLPPVNYETPILEPTSEDAVLLFLFAHLSEQGYTLVSSCYGLTLEADPDKLCIREQKADRTDPTMEVFTIGQPMPGVPWYSIYVENTSEGSWVTSASAIAR